MPRPMKRAWLSSVAIGIFLSTCSWLGAAAGAQALMQKAGWDRDPDSFLGITLNAPLPYAATDACIGHENCFTPAEDSERFEPYGAADYDVLNGPNLGFEYSEGVVTVDSRVSAIFVVSDDYGALRAATIARFGQQTRIGPVADPFPSEKNGASESMIWEGKDVRIHLTSLGLLYVVYRPLDDLYLERYNAVHRATENDAASKM